MKPIVKITGEFWAQTTEGDGNYRMFPFLEREGAQVLVEPIGTWIMYMIHQAKQANADKRRDRGRGDAGRLAHRQAHGRRPEGPQKNAALSLAEAVFTREWNRLREALGNVPHELTDQYELQHRPRCTTRAPAARATSRWPRTSTTRTRTCATWCCP